MNKLSLIFQCDRFPGCKYLLDGICYFPRSLKYVTGLKLFCLLPLFFLSGIIFSQAQPLGQGEKPACTDSPADEQWWLQLSPEWQNFFCDVYIKHKGRENLTCKTLRVFLNNLKELDTLPAVESLEPISACRNLEKLDAQTSREDAITSLKGIETLKCLKIFSIRCIKVKSLDKALRRLKNLEVLNLFGIGVERIGPRELPGNIREIYLSLPLEDLKFLQSLKKAEVVSISGRYTGIETFKLEQVAPLKQLKRLSFFNCSVEASEKVSFSKLKAIQLQYISNEFNLEFLSGSKELETLKIESCNITGNLGFFQNLKNLKSLKISFNYILRNSDSVYNRELEGDFVSNIRYLTGLERLEISHSRIIRDLKGFETLQNISYLDLSGSKLHVLDGMEQLESLTTFQCIWCESLKDASPLLNGRMSKMNEACLFRSNIPPEQDSVLKQYPNYCKALKKSEN